MHQCLRKLPLKIRAHHDASRTKATEKANLRKLRVYPNKWLKVGNQASYGGLMI